MNTPAYGLLVVGPTFGPRRLVDWATEFRTYAAVAPTTDVGEAYLSAFTFTEAIQERDDGRAVDTRDYQEPCGGEWLWFDIDRSCDLEAARLDTIRLVATVSERFDLAPDKLLIFFSGCKGFHVGLPLRVCGSPDASLHFPQTARLFAESLAGQAGVRIDLSIYDRVRLLRAPNSRHPKTGWHKRRLLVDQLINLSTSEITRLAGSPARFDVPNCGTVCRAASVAWSRFHAEATQSDRKRRTSEVDCPPRLNRLTLEFIRDGAPEGTRATTLFSAAANLAEFGSSLPLATALLEEAALDSGLAPREIARQIRSGIEHGGRNGR